MDHFGGMRRNPGAMIAMVRLRWLEEVRQMSAIGTNRLCRRVRKHFRYWRFRRNAVATPIPLILTKGDNARVRENGITARLGVTTASYSCTGKGGLCSYRRTMLRVSLRGDKRNNIRARLEFGIR